MNRSRDADGELRKDYTRLSAWLFGGLLLVVALGLLWRRERNEREETSVAAATEREVSYPAQLSTDRPPRESALRRRNSSAKAEEIVASKVAAFGRSRREMVHRISARSNKPVPPEVEQFFDAMEAGDWERIDALFGSLAKRSAQYEGSTHWPELDPFWPAVLEAYGAAEQAHDWPAQQLLDYGEAVMGSLRPGMVYVGGTDPGRFIPTLLNETSGEEQHVIITQNALADARYQEYLRFQYGDRYGISEEESARAFQSYVDDAQKRLEHDEKFPDEPKQIRPGEKVSKVDGKIQVSGATAVMDINERLLQMILDKNPEASFALEESFPMRSTYEGATPLGPIMEIRPEAPENGLDDARVAQSLDYWREKSEQVLSDPEAVLSEEALRTYSKMAVGHGNLLANGQYAAEAEEAYRIATGIYPRNTEALVGLSRVLATSGREEEAQRLIAEFARNNPDIDLKKALEPFSVTVAAPEGVSGER